MEQLSQREQGKRNYLKENKPLVYEKILKFDEKIRRGESIAIIQFQYNYTCNFKCEHCSIKRFQSRSDGAREMTIADVRELFRQADELGLARVTITGGEPLVFKDFDALVAAIDPQKFYINCDSNGFLLTAERAKHLKSIGVDRMQISLDSFDAKSHDEFRHAPGAYERVLKAVDNAKTAGLDVFMQTVVWKDRLYSDEFIKFLEYFTDKGIGVFVSYAKPVGNWERKYDGLVDKKDMAYMRELEKKYKVFTHLTPAYGLNMGCIALKGMFSVTQYGDVLPCPYIHVSIGNVLQEPLKDIIKRGFDIKYFGEYVDTCTIAEDRAFMKKYLEPRVYGKPLPVPCAEVFTDEDKTRKPFHEDPRLFENE
ncbi:radical SAM protein [Patescibacteria group bacterium]|nr:MAG: radical SAM protein [Patescibacteria group bacterium]